MLRLIFTRSIRKKKGEKRSNSVAWICALAVIIMAVTACTASTSISKAELYNGDGLTYIREDFGIKSEILFVVEGEYGEVAKGLERLSALDGVNTVLWLKTIDDAVKLIEKANDLLSLFGVPEIEITGYDKFKNVLTRELKYGGTVYLAAVFTDVSAYSESAVVIKRECENIFGERVAFGGLQGLADSPRKELKKIADDFNNWIISAVPVATERAYEDYESALLRAGGIGTVLSPFDLIPFDGGTTAKLLNSLDFSELDGISALFSNNNGVWYTLNIIIVTDARAGADTLINTSKDFYGRVRATGLPVLLYDCRQVLSLCFCLLFLLFCEITFVFFTFKKISANYQNMLYF